MSTHRKHDAKETFYFVTFTCYRWLDLFTESKVFDYFPTWFRYIQQRHCLINAYCIMPNHLHLVCFPRDECTGINHIIGEAKRFLAYEIIKRLKQLGKLEVLKTLSFGVAENERRKGKQHQVFRLSFDAKEVDYDTISPVLDYIHTNPVQSKWSLVSDPTSYRYSSAAYYETNTEKPDFLTDYRDVFADE